MLKEIKTFCNKNINYIKLIFLFVAFLMLDYISLILIKIFKFDISSLDNFLYLRIITLLIIMLIAVIVYRKDLVADWKIFKKNYKEDLKLAFTYWFVALLLMASSNYLLSKAGLSMPNNEAAVRQMLAAFPFLASLIVIILSPILEELIFRQAFYKVFNNKIIFVIVSSFLFGILHITGSFDSYYDFFFLIPYMSMGIFFALTMAKTKTIYPSVFVHVFHNLLVSFITFLISGVII